MIAGKLNQYMGNWKTVLVTSMHRNVTLSYTELYLKDDQICLFKFALFFGDVSSQLSGLQC